VDKILKGERPGHLPVAKFELVINLKTAGALGLTIPQSLLQRAGGRGDPMRTALSVTALIIAALAIGVLSTPWPAGAQPAGKVFRVGFLSLSSRASSRTPSHEALLHKLRELGYVEGRNLVFEGRWAEGDAGKLPGLAAELVRAGVDVIVTSGASIRAAMQATTTIPIVFYAVVSPIERKIVGSLARPGGNVTGVSGDVGPGIQGKRLELLKEAVPRLARVAFLVDTTSEEAPGRWKALQDAARVLNVTLVRYETAVASDFDSAFGAIVRQRPDALLQSGGQFHIVHRARIIEFASRSRLPAMYNNLTFVPDGGLMAYASSAQALAARAAIYVDKILRGAWPGDLPVERPTKFELIINLKTARTLGLMIPPSLLQRADEVIR
jgi:putative ABC transport system substrate-binding protein